MRILGLLVLALLGFYVAWPAWSGYQVKTALDGGDKATLERKIDFERLRGSLRPAVTTEVDSKVSAIAAAAGQSPEALAKLKADAVPKLTEAALTGLVTSDSILRLYRERADLKTEVARIVAAKLATPEGLAVLSSIAGSISTEKADVGSVLGQLGRMAEASGIDPGKVLGGLFGKTKPGNDPAGGSAADKGSPNAAKPAGGIGLSNIKSFTMAGPLGYAIGVAKDPAAATPDLVADLAFTGGDWKLVGLTPKR